MCRTTLQELVCTGLQQSGADAVRPCSLPDLVLSQLPPHLISCNLECGGDSSGGRRVAVGTATNPFDVVKEDDVLRSPGWQDYSVMIWGRQWVAECLGTDSVCWPSPCHLVLLQLDLGCTGLLQCSRSPP